MFNLIDDTIAAISSAAGHAPRGIVRLSGPEAVSIAAALFDDADPTPLTTRLGPRNYPGEVRITDGASVPAELYLFREPRSYTRQDMVEFHTIGAPPVLGMLLQRVIERGARAAEPGEFTARAFLNGAMSLDEAEAVAAVIHARSDAQLRCAHRARDRASFRRADAWMGQLAELLGLVEADIDFAEEPIEFITPADLAGQLALLRQELESVIRAADSVERFDVLPTVLLCGPANAGKSRLMNVLSGTDRAICSAVAGTTRDILTAPMSLAGIDCLLMDGAGLTRGDDELLRLAQSISRRTAERVDLLCLVVDLSDETGDDTFDILRKHSDRPAVIAANKADLLSRRACADRVARIRCAGHDPVIATSAVTGAGIDALKSAIRARLGQDPAGAEDRGIVLNARQHRALATAMEALDRAIGEARGLEETIDRADVIALELREAMDALGALRGRVTTDDLLTQVFANFCIGK